MMNIMEIFTGNETAALESIKNGADANVRYKKKNAMQIAAKKGKIHRTSIKYQPDNHHIKLIFPKERLFQ